MCYSVPVGVNYNGLCGGSGFESFCQWILIMLCYADPVDGNHVLNALPVGVNHVVLF